MIYTKEEFLKKLNARAADAHLSRFCTPQIAERLYTVTVCLDEAPLNLTAITAPEEVLTKHILDSLFAAAFLADLPETATLLDVGSGGGFPALPIAAALQSLSVTALDSTGKKVAYIAETAKRMGAANVHTVCARAEDAARTELREQFDAVSARAVARLPQLLEYCVPFLRPGGIFLAMKGDTAETETRDAASAAKALSCTLEQTVPYSLPGSADQRFLLIYRKISSTSATYPRNPAQIKKKPL